jgi:hypothetical protein
MEGPVTPEDKAAEAEANAKAAARADQGILPEGGAVSDGDAKDRPEWCPEKYARFNEDGSFSADLSAAEMSKGMDHLNKMATQNRQADGDDGDGSGEEVPLSEQSGESDDALTSPEFWSGLTDEFNDNGKLTDESQKIVLDLGIPQQMIDDFIAGQAARGDAYQAKVTSVLGDNGASEYEALVAWGGENMTEAEAKVFNDSIQSGDMTRAQIAVRDLKVQYVKAEGSYDGLALGGSGSSGPAGAQPFASRYEQSQAIRDPRYEKDSAYRKSVEDRIVATSF